MINKFLALDRLAYGILLGLFFPVIVFAVLLGAESIAKHVFGMEQLMQRSTMMLVSIFVNLFTMRYFLVTRKSDKTGRGILLATFVLALVFFFFLIDL